MNVNITGPRILAEFSFFGLCDVTITQTTLTSLLVLAAVTILCWRLGRNLRKRPGRPGAPAVPVPPLKPQRVPAGPKRTEPLRPRMPGCLPQPR